jgi:hypothetical protein
MDAEELVHCHTVARLLLTRVLSEISQRLGPSETHGASSHDDVGDSTLLSDAPAAVGCVHVRTHARSD